MPAQARFYPGAGSGTDGSELIWKMLQILEKGNERDWVVTIIKDVIGGIEDLKHSKHAMEKIPLMLSMASVVPSTLQELVQVIHLNSSNSFKGYGPQPSANLHALLKE